MDRLIEESYRLARQRYAQFDVDVERALQRLAQRAISVHCWQGDDVAGFENRGEAIGGGLAVTGAYPGRARTPDELRSDLDKALSLIPGTHRVNLHASYAETGGRRVERNELQPEHFQNWVAWAQERQLGLDFNPTFFAHPRAADGLTLAHPDDALRRFWIEHGQVCRRIGAWMGATLGRTCVNNIWIPDGMKDLPIDRLGPRRRLEAALDEVFQEPFDAAHLRDAVECKLFGLGSESYVAGSHEFYLGYAITRQKVLCLDTGHFHPTETVSDKLSAIALFVPELLLHVSRGVRWDSDHVVIMSDELLALAQELVRGELLERVHLGLDYFDASINRVAAWVIGTRCLLRALLVALLEPVERLREYEANWDFTSRLALAEELKTLPHGAVWDYYCLQQGVPVGHSWLDEVKRYEQQEVNRRVD